MAAEQSVLHVLPHPGGGGETYVEALTPMEGYRFERAYLAPSAKPESRASVATSALRIQRAASRFDVLHVVGEVAAALCLPALALRPSVMSPQGLHLLRRAQGAAGTAARANLRVVARAATRVVCSSSSECVELVAVVGPGAQTVVVNNGVPLRERVSEERRAQLRGELGLPPSAVVGAWIGALDEHKDPLTAVRALTSARRAGSPVVLLVAGEGPLRAEVERAGEEGGVQVLGQRDDVERILGASDFFVLASRREGLSFALLEAMSFGLVPVVSDAPGNIDAVGEAGIVVPFGDTAAFASAFARLAAGEDARRALGEQARERVERDFSVDEMLRRTRAVYDEVVASRRTRRGGA